MKPILRRRGDRDPHGVGAAQLPVSKACSPCARRAASNAGCFDGTTRSRRNPELLSVDDPEITSDGVVEAVPVVGGFAPQDFTRGIRELPAFGVAFAGCDVFVHEAPQPRGRRPPRWKMMRATVQAGWEVGSMPKCNLSPAFP